MTQAGNTARKLVADDDLGPDLLSDPAFVPCRDEYCMRPDLHRAHKEPRSRSGRNAHQRYDKCPECQTPVVVTNLGRNQKAKRQHLISASCPACGWFHTKALKSNA